MLRREVLSSGQASAPQTAAEQSALEAKAFAAAAAFDKGVSLGPEALERYSRFFDMPSESQTGEKNAYSDGGGKGNSPDREEIPQKEELQAIAEKEAEEDSLLDMMNRIPGKNGQHWAVFPFNITLRGVELQVFLRILKGEAFSGGENEHLIIDISAPAHQYRCFLRKTGINIQADIQVYPELSPRALKSLTKKAEKLLSFGEILVRNGSGTPSWTEDWSAECLPSVNKTV